MGLTTQVHLNHWFDVVARQLAALYDTYTNLDTTRVHSYQLITATTQTWILTVNIHQIRSFKLRPRMLMFLYNFFVFDGWWKLLWLMKKKRFDYSGKQKWELRQYLEVLRFVGQGSVPLTAEPAWLSVGFPRLSCWSGSRHTSTLAPSVHKGLPVIAGIAAIAASWEARQVIFMHTVCSSIKYFHDLPASTYGVSPSGWSFTVVVAFGGGSYPISKFMVAWKIRCEHSTTDSP